MVGECTPLIRLTSGDIFTLRALVAEEMKAELRHEMARGCKRVKIFQAAEEGEQKRRCMARRAIDAVHRMAFFYRTRSSTARVMKLQRWYRYWHNFKCTNSLEEWDGERDVLTQEGQTVLCPLTHDPVPVTDSFKLVNADGKVTAYTASELARYFSQTSTFLCPMTRREIVIVEVRRLLRRLLKCRVQSGLDIVKKFNKALEAKKQEEEEEETPEFFINMLLDNFISVLTVCENGSGFEDSEEDEVDSERAGTIQENAFATLETSMLPQWRYAAEQLGILNTDRCLEILVNCEDQISEVIHSGSDNTGLGPYVASVVTNTIRDIREWSQTEDASEGETDGLLEEIIQEENTQNLATEVIVDLSGETSA